SDDDAEAGTHLQRPWPTRRRASTQLRRQTRQCRARLFGTACGLIPAATQRRTSTTDDNNAVFHYAVIHALRRTVPTSRSLQAGLADSGTATEPLQPFSFMEEHS